MNDMEQHGGSVEQQQHEGVISVVFTAENHLGYVAFGQHPRKREERQQRLRQAFQQATDFAIRQGVDLFIQGGDLFETTTPDERDRSFVAARLAQLKQAGIRTFALGGVHDTPSNMQPLVEEATPAPQISYARLEALHYFPPVQKNQTQALEPALLDIRGTSVAICGLGVLTDHEGDPLANLRVQEDVELADFSMLVLHAPIEGFADNSSLLDRRAQVSRSTIAKQNIFRYILGGYHHSHSRISINQSDVIIAGATQHVDFSASDSAPGFVFMGLAADGIRWCNHIPVESLNLQRLVIPTGELWQDDNSKTPNLPTERILERLRPLCHADSMIQLRLVGELTRMQYHQLDLNEIRRYGEEHCFALAIDDSALSLLPEQEAILTESGERLSPREELIALTDEWIAATTDEQEKKALRMTKEELLQVMDEVKSRR